jgi:hypothetical protein
VCASLEFGFHFALYLKEQADHYEKHKLESEPPKYTLCLIQSTVVDVLDRVNFKQLSDHAFTEGVHHFDFEVYLALLLSV